MSRISPNLVVEKNKRNLIDKTNRYGKSTNKKRENHTFRWDLFRDQAV